MSRLIESNPRSQRGRARALTIAQPKSGAIIGLVDIKSNYHLHRISTQTDVKLRIMGRSNANCFAQHHSCNVQC
jgi:hypothetical protein